MGAMGAMGAMGHYSIYVALLQTVADTHGKPWICWHMAAVNKAVGV